MRIYKLDPIRDPRWRAFVERHPQATVFHSPEWLEALQSTYRYEPVVVTTCPPGGDLGNGLVFCRIKSWLTGERMVSLPFSDHCQPLIDGEKDLKSVLGYLNGEVDAGRGKYVEIRSTGMDVPFASEASTVCFHSLNLEPGLDALMSKFHKTAIAQMIRRAGRESITCEEGRSKSLLARFYDLLVLTRRRQNLPPQPFAWFCNLAALLKDNLTVRLVSKDGAPIASILTLSHKKRLVYKYGCSDKQFSNLGGTQLLIWNAIQAAKLEGIVELDMGRSDWDNRGLIEFKDRWGAQRSVLKYFRYPDPPQEKARFWQLPVVSNLVGRLPAAVLTRAGGALYKHIG